MNKVAESFRSVASGERSIAYNRIGDNDYIDSVLVKRSDTNIDNLEATFYLYITEEEAREIRDSDSDVSFINIFGPNKQFKYIFSSLKEVTSLSKSEISETLHGEFTCEDSKFREDFSPFKFEIREDSIIVEE